MRRLAKYKNKVLTVFCLPKAANKTQEEIFANWGVSPFIELYEDVIFGEEAVKYLKIKAKGLLMLIQIVKREQEGHRLTDDSSPSSTCYFPAQHAGEEDIQHQIHHRGNANKQKRPFGVAHATQHGGDHVVAVDKHQTHDAHGGITQRFIKSFLRGVHQG